MKAALIVLVFLVVLFSTRVAMACSCSGTPTICASFASAEAVFVGTVARVENITVKVDDGQEYISGQTAYVHVEESFKGVKETEMIFRSYGTSCDFHYKEGQRALFYAHFDKDDKSWSVPACDRSAWLESAADDLQYLRNLPVSLQKTLISGVLQTSTEKPLTGIKVKVTDGKQVYETFTDKNGVYEVVGLPPGKYLVEPEAPLNLTASFPTYSGEVDGPARKNPRVVLKENGCAGVSFYFTENTFISGKVISPYGRPLQNVCVRLRLKDKPAETNYLGTCSNAEGSFKIEHIPLGEYLLVANEDGKISNFEPFRTLYYPGVFEKERATVLKLRSGDQRNDVNIHVPTQEATWMISGRLLFSDGRPVEGESVEFIPEAEGSKQSEKVHVVTDAEGRFSFPMLDGSKGSLRGYIYTYVGHYVNCPRHDELIKKQGNRGHMYTNVMNLEVYRDYDELELKLPFPNCAKAKDPD